MANNAAAVKALQQLSDTVAKSDCGHIEINITVNFNGEVTKEKASGGCPSEAWKPVLNGLNRQVPAGEGGNTHGRSMFDFYV